MLIKDAGRKRPHGRHARRLLYLFIGELELLVVIVGIRHTFQFGKGLLGQCPHIPVHICRAAVILPIVLRRSALWYIQIRFSSSTVKCICHTSNSFFLVLAAAFLGLAACLLSVSCLRIEGRGLRIDTSRRSSLPIMAYTPCRSFMPVKHRDL